MSIPPSLYVLRAKPLHPLLKLEHCLLGISLDIAAFNALTFVIARPVDHLNMTEGLHGWTGTGGSTMKVCFVTTGATAPFTGLIESVLRPASIAALQEVGITHLLVQHGTAKDVFDASSTAARAQSQHEHGKPALEIQGIDFNPNGLKDLFQLAQQSQGLVISHAGLSSRLVYI